ncbi:MAG: hypothetical protein HUU35_14115, partial [Armatimonadetes bacterium]|nr:hypothetical protein [Armatimonadota bacterium]
WAELAERLRLPLVVAEAGPDASAWQGGSYKSFHYALGELHHYQELLLHARPQSILLWEYTADYGVLDTVTGSDGKPTLVETPRYWFQAQWCNLTPHNSEALGSGSDSANVLLTAFRGPDGGPLVLHLSNPGAARQACVRGLPAGLGRLRMIHSGRAAGLVEGPPVQVDNGVAIIDLPAQSMVTLTTAER